MRKLPLKTFWSLHRNIDRIEAERALQTSEILVKTQSQDGIESLFKELRKQMGTVVEFGPLEPTLAQKETLSAERKRKLNALGDTRVLDVRN